MQNFTSNGFASSLVTREDAQGNYTATVVGSISYWPHVNGVVQLKSRQVVTATLVFSAMADGTFSEGVTLAALSGQVLFTTGTNADGSLALWDLSTGSVQITL